MENETLDGPWKVVFCTLDSLEENLNELVVEGYLIHSIHPKNEGFTVCGIEQKFVQPANVLTEEQVKELTEKLNESSEQPVS